MPFRAAKKGKAQLTLLATLASLWAKQVEPKVVLAAAAA